MGGLTADAAAMPLHWIYDTASIDSILAAAGRTSTPEFLRPSHAPFYDYPVGSGTPFAEVSLASLTVALLGWAQQPIIQLFYVQACRYNRQRKRARSCGGVYRW